MTLNVDINKIETIDVDFTSPQPLNVVIENKESLNITPNFEPINLEFVNQKLDIQFSKPKLNIDITNKDPLSVEFAYLGRDGKQGFQGLGTIHLYQRSGTAPVTPGNSNYNWSSKEIVSIPSGWLLEPSTESGTIWTTTAILNQANAVLDIQELDWSNVYQAGTIGETGASLKTLAIQSSSNANGSISIDIVGTLDNDVVLPATNTIQIPAGAKGSTPTFEAFSVDPVTYKPSFTFDGTTFTADVSIRGATGATGSSPTEYLKDASVTNDTLTITKQDDSTITFTDQKQDVTALTARVSVNETDIGANETAIAANTTNIATNISDINDIEETIANNIEPDITTIKSDINSLETKEGQFDTRVTAVETKSTNNATAIASEITRAKAAEAANTTLISTINTTTIPALSTRVTTVTDNFNTHKNTYEAKVNLINTQVEENESDIGTVKSEISDTRDTAVDVENITIDNSTITFTSIDGSQTKDISVSSANELTTGGETGSETITLKITSGDLEGYSAVFSRPTGAPSLSAALYNGSSLVSSVSKSIFDTFSLTADTLRLTAGSTNTNDFPFESLTNVTSTAGTVGSVAGNLVDITLTTFVEGTTYSGTGTVKIERKTAETLTASKSAQISRFTPYWYKANTTAPTTFAGLSSFTQSTSNWNGSLTNSTAGTFVFATTNQFTSCVLDGVQDYQFSTPTTITKADYNGADQTIYVYSMPGLDPASLGSFTS